MKTSKIAKLFPPFLELMLPELMKLAWRRETSSPLVHDQWRPDDPGKGQDAITALVVQDHLGGELLRADIKDYGFHYWNRLPDGREYDLTLEQLPKDRTRPKGQVVARKDVLDSDRAVAKSTRDRYSMLTDRLDDVITQFGRYLGRHGASGAPTDT